MTQVAIQIPDELSQFVEESVQSGAYHDTDEFFASLLYSLKEQSDAELTEVERQKLSALRGDIQHAAEQLDRGEGIRDFDYDAFLAERHRLRAGGQPA
jgi:Arc/MetJ-type ribon-helix-helix transcriptional regulator